MAPVDNHIDHSDEIDLGELLTVLLRGWKLITFIFVVVLLLGAVYAFLGPATYEWRAVARVNAANPVLERLALTRDAKVQEKMAEEQLEQLSSTKVLTAAVTATQANTQVHILNRIPILGGLMARHHERTHEDLAPPFLGLDGLAWGGEQLVLKELQLPLLAAEQYFVLERTNDGYVLFDDEGAVLVDAGVLGQPIEFEFEGRQGRLTVDEVIGRVGTRFKIVQEPFFDTVQTLDEDLSIESLDIGRERQQFLITYRSPDLLGGSDFIGALVDQYADHLQAEVVALAKESLSVLQSQLPTLNNNQQVAAQALQHFKEQNPEVRLSSSLQNLLEDSLAVETERADFKLQRDALTSHYGSDHFLVEELDKRLAQLRQERDTLDALISDYVGLEGELLRLERDAQMTANLFDAANKEVKDLQAAIENGTSSQIQADFTVSRPEVVSPKRVLVLAVSVLLGLMLGVFVVLMRAFIRPVIYAPSALQNLTQLNTIAVPEAPHRRASTRRETSQGLLLDTAPAHPALESLRALRASFDGPGWAQAQHKLAVVGPTADVGVNFVAANTAALLALEGKRVLLIDADMRHSLLHAYLGYEVGLPGLADVLSGQAEGAEVLVELRDGLTVLPAGVRPDNPTELLLQPQLAALLAELGAGYDYVLLATPPILPVADTLAILRHVDAGYLVVRADQSTQNEVREALDRLQTAAVRECLRGAVLTGVAQRAH